MPIIKRIFYVCGMAGVTSGLVVPIDLAFNFGLFEFFVSPWVFLIAIPFWILAPWMSEIIPYDRDDDY